MEKIDDILGRSPETIDSILGSPRISDILGVSDRAVSPESTALQLQALSQSGPRSPEERAAQNYDIARQQGLAIETARPKGIWDPMIEMAAISRDEMAGALASEGLVPQITLEDRAAPNSGLTVTHETAETVAGVANVGTRAALSMTSPGAIATIPLLGAPGAIARPISVAFAAYTAAQLPGAAQRAGEASVTGTLQEKVEAYGDALVTGLFTIAAANHANPLEVIREVRSKLVESGEPLTPARQAFLDRLAEPATEKLTVFKEPTPAELEGAALPLTAKVAEEASTKAVEATAQPSTESPAEVPQGTSEQNLAQSENAPEIPALNIESGPVDNPNESAISGQNTPSKSGDGLGQVLSPDQLAEQGDPIAKQIARGYNQLPLDEALAAANTGLDSAVKTFNPAKGSFDDHVTTSVYNALHDALRKNNALKRGGGVEKVSLQSDLPGDTGQQRAEMVADESISGPSTQAQVAELSGKLQSAIARLPRDQQRTVKEFLESGRGRLNESARKALKRAIAEEGLTREDLEGAGPGGTTSTGFHRDALLRLTEELSILDPVRLPWRERLNIAQHWAEVVSNARDKLSSAKAAAQGTAAWLGERLGRPPEITDLKKAAGEWSLADQEQGHTARSFAKEVRRAFPDKRKRAAVSKWINADGDAAKLQDWVNRSKPEFKQPYEDALKLSADEKYFAQRIQAYFESRLQQGIKTGVLDHGVDNYLTRIYPKKSDLLPIRADLQSGKLRTDFQFAKKRIFETDFDAEQSGLKPINDVADRILAYDYGFNRSLSSRAFVRALHESKASDGRPLVEISGSGRPLVDKATGQAGGFFVKPKSKPEDVGDYQTVDHPALRKWKWVGKDPEGKPIFMEGDMIVHPEAVRQMRNMLETSWWSKNPVARNVLRASSTIKQTLLSLSLFHPVQIGTHALEHGVNPLNRTKIDFEDPTQRALVSRGLMVVDHHGMQEFSEGLMGPGLFKHIPIAGDILGRVNDWLFKDYIPEIKMTMALKALESNTKLYGKDLSRDQILELTSKQANAAFGELNYRYMARNPTVQGWLRAVLLAPDFLEARARFVGQALNPKYGREQQVALIAGGVAIYALGRVLSKTLDNDYHWDKPFSFVYQGHEYGLRTVQGDIWHEITDPRSFWYHRLNPATTRTGIEAITGRDDRGVKRTALEQLKDFASIIQPISTKTRDDQTIWESLLNSMGIVTRRYQVGGKVYEMAHDWVKKNGTPDQRATVLRAESGAYGESPYKPIINALKNEDRGQFDKALSDLVKSGKSPVAIQQYFKNYAGKTFTGNASLDGQFYKSLGSEDKKLVDQAREERVLIVRKYLEFSKPSKQ